ncbi:MAG: Cadherin-like beta sandwich protein, partial [Thermoleophilia bacterium]|nr:Cadherin-like beta sandwich protein [Thermoleophilia bacterium]
MWIRRDYDRPGDESTGEGVGRWIMVHPRSGLTRWMACLGVVGVCLATLWGGISPGASGSIVVAADVPSATSIDVTGCRSATPGVTSLGMVLPGSSVTSTIDCSVAFSSSNDRSMLRGWQADAAGSTMTRTQSTQSIASRYETFHGVTMVDPTHGWAVGQNGIVRATSDGVTWTTQSSGVGERLFAVAGASASNAVAVGELGRVVRTTNGGATWTAASVSGGVELRGVDWVSGTTYVAVGAGGYLATSADGGATWTQRTSGTTVDLRAVEMGSSTVGWAIGAAGTLLATGDGGQSWAAQASGVASNLRSIDAISATTAAIGSASSVVLTTTNGGSTWV